MDKLKYIVGLLFYVGAGYFFIYGIWNIVQGAQMPESAGLGAWAYIGGGMILIGIGALIIGLRFILKRYSIL